MASVSADYAMQIVDILEQLAHDAELQISSAKELAAKIRLVAEILELKTRKE